MSKIKNLTCAECDGDLTLQKNTLCLKCYKVTNRGNVDWIKELLAHKSHIIVDLETENERLEKLLYEVCHMVCVTMCSYYETGCKEEDCYFYSTLKEVESN